VAEYLIYFNQQWVGDHTEEWFRSRGPLAMAVVQEMKDAGVYVFAGGLEEGGPVFSADATSGSVKMRGRVFTPRPVTWRTRADVLVVLKRWKSFSRGGDELQIFELH